MNQTNSPGEDWKHETLPLVIGVTGHRNIPAAHIQKLEALAGKFFEIVIKCCPKAVLLSPLAEGADRLVAREALKKNIRLYVPLPMRRELYEADFKTHDSLAEFRNLLQQAKTTFELPLLEGLTEKQISSDGEERNRQYEQVGAYIVRHCQILIALWDGLSTNLIGGTSRIVDFQRQGVPPPYAPESSLLDAVETGPIYVITTPRDEEGHKAKGELFSTEVLFPIGYSRGPEDHHKGLRERIPKLIRRMRKAAKPEQSILEKTIEPLCLHMNIFNKMVTEQASMLEADKRTSMEYLFPEKKAAELPKSLQALRERYGVADRLAMHFQSQLKRTLDLLYILVLVAALSFGVYAHLLHDWRILVLYLVVTAVAYQLIHRRAKRLEFQNKYQDYRALAEGIRVQFFWCLANLKLSVADHYLRKQKSELDWIRYAIRTWTIPEPGSEPLDYAPMKQAATSPQTNLTEQAIEHWVQDQARYFGRRAREDNEKLERLEFWSWLLLATGIFIAFLESLCFFIAYLIQYPLEEHLHSETLYGALILSMSLPPVGAALLHSYTGKIALSEQVKQYSRMERMYTLAEQHLRRLTGYQQHKPPEELAHDAQEVKKLITELGKEALSENADWVLLHRERPVDPPHAV